MLTASPQVVTISLLQKRSRKYGFAISLATVFRVPIFHVFVHRILHQDSNSIHFRLHSLQQIPNMTSIEVVLSMSTLFCRNTYLESSKSISRAVIKQFYSFRKWTINQDNHSTAWLIMDSAPPQPQSRHHLLHSSTRVLRRTLQ